jgi:hypothetical protein
MRRRCWMYAMVLGVLGIESNIGWAQTKAAVVSLKPYGAMSQVELDENHPIADKPGWMTSGPPGGIAWRGIGDVAIDGEGRVYVGLPIWTTGYAPKADASTSAARGTGDKLRVLVFNGTGKGELESKLDFPSKSLDRLDLRLAADGTLLVLADDKLMRVDANGKPTAQLDVPNVQKEFEVWYLRSSSSGRTVRLRLNDKSAEFVDTQTLAVIKQCQVANDLNDTGLLTDDLELMSMVETTQPSLTYGLERERFCKTRERLQSFGNIDFVPSIVDDDRLLAIAPESIALRKMSGETIWTSNAPAARFLQQYEGDARLSRDGSRVAVRVLKRIEYRTPQKRQPPEWEPDGGQHSRDGLTYPRVKTVEVDDGVAVWDMVSGRLIGQVPVEGREGEKYYKPRSAFALSPDGKLLAVLQEGWLTIWKMD